MNAADIETARRLIAQFEGSALGRHNSNQWNRPGQQAPEQRWRNVCLEHDPQDCEIGDYCWSLGFDVPNDQLVRMVLKPGASPMFDDATAMEFERVRLFVSGSGGRSAWRRVA